MKNKNFIKDDFISSSDIISLLLFENTILQKKINNQNLTPKEQFFDSFFVAPSFMLNRIINSLNRKESGHNRV